MKDQKCYLPNVFRSSFFKIAKELNFAKSTSLKKNIEELKQIKQKNPCTLVFHLTFAFALITAQHFQTLNCFS